MSIDLRNMGEVFLSGSTVPTRRNGYYAAPRGPQSWEVALCDCPEAESKGVVLAIAINPWIGRYVLLGRVGSADEAIKVLLRVAALERSIPFKISFSSDLEAESGALFCSALLIKVDVDQVIKNQSFFDSLYLESYISGTIYCAVNRRKTGHAQAG
jgi:hypothetical protein